MTRYWVISPTGVDRPEWEKVWQYDLENGIISIGWRELGEVPPNEQDLRELIDQNFPQYKPARKTLVFGMIWDFFHSVKPGDVIIARRGRKQIAAVGIVSRAAYHERKVAHPLEPDPYKNHLDVHWENEPRNKSFGCSLCVDRLFLGRIASQHSRRTRRRNPSGQTCDKPVAPYPDAGLVHCCSVLVRSLRCQAGYFLMSLPVRLDALELSVRGSNCGFQVAPPSLVAQIMPEFPAIHPWLVSTKRTG